MACGKCGKKGHNRVTCPDQILIIRIGGLTVRQVLKLTSIIKKAKALFAPGSQGTVVSGSAKDLKESQSKSIGDS